MRTRQQFAHFFFQENFCPPTRQWSGKSSLSSKKCSLTSQKELRKWWMPNMEKSGSETPNVFMQQSMATSTISIWSLYAQCSHFTDCWVKIKTTSAGYWMPASYICQVGQKIRCHTLFEKKKKRSDYFAVTFGLLQVICVKWGMSNHILHTFSLKSSCVHRGPGSQGRVSIDLHMLTTWICLQGPLPFILATSKAFGTCLMKPNVTPAVTRHLTTKCDKRYT